MTITRQVQIIQTIISRFENVMLIVLQVQQLQICLFDFPVNYFFDVTLLQLEQ